jgi:hypothetical protein
MRKASAVSSAVCSWCFILYCRGFKIFYTSGRTSWMGNILLHEHDAREILIFRVCVSSGTRPRSHENLLKN